MFHIPVEEKNGVEMELGMIYTLLDLMEHIYGQVFVLFSLRCVLYRYINIYIFIYSCIGGRKSEVMAGTQPTSIKKTDVIGCALDLTIPIITFTLNGQLIHGAFRDFNLDGMFFPVISCSSKVR